MTKVNHMIHPVNRFVASCAFDIESRNLHVAQTTAPCPVRPPSAASAICSSLMLCHVSLMRTNLAAVKPRVETQRVGELADRIVHGFAAGRHGCTSCGRRGRTAALLSLLAESVAASSTMTAPKAKGINRCALDMVGAQQHHHHGRVLHRR